ncbi:MAG: hypothetical protein IPP93_13325 [Chitinophagaceae bacterium]|nr:hypothetical protein [Chitinophagaceae bacterium]
MHSKIILAVSLFLASLPAGAQNIGIGNSNPEFPLDITGRVRLRTGIGSAGFFLNSEDNTDIPAFIGMRYDSLVGFYGNISGWKFVMNTNTGNIALGDFNPTSPLSFPAYLGKKISLYKGVTGDAGFSVWGSELRIHSDYDNADITFGYDDLTKGFTERMRIKGNGSVGIGTANPDSRSSLDMSASNKPMIMPYMTTMQRNQIPDPAPGMTIFNTSSDCLETVRANKKWWNLCKSQYTETSGIGVTYGGQSDESIKTTKPTPDNGVIAIGTTTSYNSGTFSNLTNYGLEEGLIMKFDSLGTLTWQRLIGGSGNDRLADIRLTVDGGYIVCGSTESSNSGDLTGLFSNGSYDAWVIKLNATGQIEWQKLLGGSDNDVLLAVVQLNDGGYLLAGQSFYTNSGTIAGTTSYGSGDGWIVKLDGSGNQVWQQLYGGDDFDAFMFMEKANDGNVFIGGFAASSNNGYLTGLINNGQEDFWAIKMNPLNGAFVWQKLLGGINRDLIQSITPGNNGGILLTGYSSTPNTGTLTGLTGFGDIDMWVVKLSETGLIEWQKLWGTSSFDIPGKASAIPGGGYLFTGTAYLQDGTLQNIPGFSSADGWIIRTDNTGNIIWQKLIGGNMGDNATTITPLGNNRVAVFLSSASTTGMLADLSHFGNTDIWRLIIDMNGNPLFL